MGAGSSSSARRMSPRRAAVIWLALAAAVGLLLVISLATGSVRIAPARVLAALAGSPGFDADIVRALRLPRALAGFACGALLSLAGALLQVLLRNPLADPYVLGVSGGAAAFAVAAMLLGVPWWGTQVAAFAGSLAAMGIVFGLVRRALWLGEPRDASPRLLLTGVVVAAGFSAATALMMTLSPDRALRGIVFWLQGDLNGAGMPWFALAVLAMLVALCAPVTRQLNALARGDQFAQALGVPVVALRARVYVMASLAAAAAVTTAGTLGFVGLVAPHLVRLAWGNDQRMLVPASMLGGGAAVMGADLVARCAFAPTQLPVGVVTALVGVPLFLWMLLGRKR
ncbi:MULTISPECIES: FecCD family ABC transporter permease [Mycetohabitans]|uniref:Iron complex transport system permease protein n=1 Tax=Mycetohabitans endofungorum TaxID=417203 RepID=A0A2P5KE84_9BURK|nr:iron complex transport system permease protein [Mycetohabitans endofungorum]